MGRHSKVAVRPAPRATARRRTSSLLLALIAAPAAAIVVSGGDVARFETEKTAVQSTPPGAEVVAAPLIRDILVPGVIPVPGGTRVMTVATRSSVHRSLLPPGDCNEEGLQVDTILAARSVSAVFPEITDIGGVRSDALRWHPQGLAIDVMIPDPYSDAGKALGDEIVAYVLMNADRFQLHHMIWRGVSYGHRDGIGTAKSRGIGHGDHYDHVHIATKGGGYPRGAETYLR